MLKQYSFYKQKLSLSILLVIAFTTLNSCKRGCRQVTAKNYCFDCTSDCSKDNCCGCCIYDTVTQTSSQKGALLFWTNTSSYGYINISLSNGQTNTITTCYGCVYSGNPACLSANGAYFYLNEGSYGYTASTQNGTVIKSGTIALVANNCNRVLVP